MRQQSILTVLISFLLTLQGGSSLYMEQTKNVKIFILFQILLFALNIILHVS